MNRLSTIAPGFVQRTQHFTDAALRTCARNACRAAASAIQATALQAEVVATFPHESSACSGLAPELAAEAAKWDDIYLDKHDTDPETGLEEFTLARLGTALVNLLSASRADLYDCIYEACMVVDDPAPVLAAALPPAPQPEGRQ